MKQIIMNCQLIQIRIAVIEEGKLVEFYLEQPSTDRLVGNIYKGKVADVRPGIQAAFVDIGLEKNGYLYIDDCLTSEQKEKSATKPNIREVVTQGQELLLQVTKEPFGTKGARLSTNLSFPGKLLVYMPQDPYIGVSRKIEAEEERERLRQICQKICIESEGGIVRTGAEGASEDEITADFVRLRKQWETVKQQTKTAKARTVVYEELSLVPKIMRDLLDTQLHEWVVDSDTHYRQILNEIELIRPEVKDKIKLYRDRTSIFDAYGVEGEIDKALKRKVWLKSGGYIVIDHTEALTAIDVNTGKFTGSYNQEDTVLKTNLEAAGEIARQLRLRDIGGIIIIDFIDMLKEPYKDAVYRKLSEHLKKDRTKSHLLGFTSLGLLEMTRKKVKQNILDRLTRECPSCEGRGKVLSENTVLAKMEREIKEYRNQEFEAFLISVHPDLARRFNEEHSLAFQTMEKEWGIRIFLRDDEKIAQDSYHLSFVGSLEEVKRRI